MLNIYPGPGYGIPQRDREVLVRKEKRSDMTLAVIALAVCFAMGALATLGVVALIVISR